MTTPSASPPPAPLHVAWWHRWRARKTPIDGRRWVIVDTETSGLDAQRDRLLAIAGVAVLWDPAQPRIAIGDSMEVVLRQAQAPLNKPNILLHGIGVAAQAQGDPPEVALAAFARWVGTSPLIAFHSAFDEAVLARALQAVGQSLPKPWLDLAHVAEVVRPDAKARSLDQWMAALGVVCAARHQAAADALATGEVLLRLWPDIAKALRPRAPDFAGLQGLAAQRRWARPARG
ncbi:3'-5' exonuclease [Rhodoferax sp.]|jgi:DNA polymerase-3 subunit epsilon|uniref:3'-5' exonuclease n=1 Tax=Rhodoferax sp. TaxID=50421 RepID=UPI00378378ED